VEALNTFFSALGGVAVSLAVLPWIARSIVSHLLSKDIEKFKLELQIESQRELMNLKASIELKAFEHQVRFSRLHERRAEVVGQLFSKIVALTKSASDFVRGFQSADDLKTRDRLYRLWETVDDFTVHFEKHSIYFERGVCERIIDFRGKLSSACSVLASFVQEKEAIEMPYDHLVEEWDKALGMIEQEVPVIKSALEESFREILGVSQFKKG
jgi:hypothetical protein